MPRTKPHRFHDAIGQVRLFTDLLRQIEGAKTLGEACPHLLFVAPPGYGKSCLARAVACEFGSGFARIDASDRTSREAIVTALRRLQAGDVLFIDEAHRLRPDAREALYPAIDDGELPSGGPPGPNGEGREEIPCFTLVAATTEPTALGTPLLSRLRLLEFDPYSPAELKAIAERAAGLAERSISPQAANRLARMPDMSPRRICQFVEDMVRAAPLELHLGVDVLTLVLSDRGIDEHGLGPTQRRYLLVLAESPDEQSSITRLTHALALGQRTVRGMIEPLLFQLGLIEQTAKNLRALTGQGRGVVRAVSRESPEQQETAHE